jgi:hypothetical protein
VQSRNGGRPLTLLQQTVRMLMKPIHFQRARLGAIASVALLLSGCHKSDPVSELEKAASAMAAAQPAATPSNAGSAPETAAPPPADQVQAAVADYKAGKMEDAVTRLQLLRAVPTLTPEQRMALQDSVAAVMTEIYSLAQKGDPRAIAAVAAYEKMQTGR